MDINEVKKIISGVSTETAIKILDEAKICMNIRSNKNNIVTKKDVCLAARFYVK